MRQIKRVVLAIGLLISLAATPPVYAVDVFKSCSGVDSPICSSTGSGGEATSMVKTIIDTLLYCLGIIAVAMIIFGGLKYVISRGDFEKIKSAKDTVLYATVGLVVALAAYAIVNFVLKSFK